MQDAYSLTADDYRETLEGVSELYANLDLSAFPQACLRLLRRLIPTTFTSYNELNLRNGQVLIVYDPPEMKAQCDEILPILHQYGHQHPLLAKSTTEGIAHAEKISDYVQWDHLQKLELYQRCLKRIGVGDSLSFGVQNTAFTIIFFVLNREEPTFTERDRALANLLRPHLTQAFENAQAFTEAQAVALQTAESLETVPHGLAITGHEGLLRHANEKAVEMMDRFFPAPVVQPRTLPKPIAQWLAEALRQSGLPPAPFRLVQGDRTLVVRLQPRVDSCLLLFLERGPAPTAQRLESLGLSPREAEVLFWLSQGKSNPEIGIILGISGRTVGKHVENLYTKLGVSTRPAAMLAALPLLQE